MPDRGLASSPFCLDNSGLRLAESSHCDHNSPTLSGEPGCSAWFFLFDILRGRISACSGMRWANYSQPTGDFAMKLLNLDFTRISHDTFRIAGSKVIYTDPYKVA